MDCNIAGGHVTSFDYIVDEGLDHAVKDTEPERFLINDDKVELWLEGPSLSRPTGVGEGGGALKGIGGPLLPNECRLRGITYKGQLQVTMKCKVNGRELMGVEKVLGEIPIMLRSKRCHLHGMDEAALTKGGEEPVEHGGYYVVNGSEKVVEVVRYLILLRRNFPVAMEKERFRTRGALFSQFAVTLRCVRRNHTASTMSLHYLENGTMMLLLKYGKEMFYLPLVYVLKALGDVSDRELYAELMRGREDDAFWRACVASMLRAAQGRVQEAGVVGQDEALVLLGSTFRVVLGDVVAPWDSDEDSARLLLRLALAVHLDEPMEKLHLLCFCAQKLMSLVRGGCLPESPDNPQFQEVSMSGHLLLQIAKERFEACLSRLRKNIYFSASRKGVDFTLTHDAFSKAVASLPGSEFTRPLEYFLATGNLLSKTGLGLMQTTGFTVIAERINQLRFYSHFRAVHRGAFFMEMRTTEVRKLRPEAWGFICPVHTPDGAPCGLLNHLAAACEVVTYDGDDGPVRRALLEAGLVPIGTVNLFPSAPLPVLLDGVLVGYLTDLLARSTVYKLRQAKVDGSVGKFVEVCLVTKPKVPGAKGQYPGLYIFTKAGRLVRPVRNMVHDNTEYIGTFEQVYLSICVNPKLELEWGETMHQELKPNSLFSLAGNLIPFPDHNQSPRNVYQCQMGKQTMGFPLYSWNRRADHKMYRIQTPQSPIVKPEAYDKYGMDTYPLGTNAIVAVISYTGYDMEDAMVINRSSYQRGFAHGTVYKVERLWLSDPRNRTANRREFFARDPFKAKELDPFMDKDGLPHIGRFYSQGDPYSSTYDPDKQEYFVKKYKSGEQGMVGDVRVLEEAGLPGITHALVQWRIPRNPIIGDKFASRAGIEDCTPFVYDEEDTGIDYAGRLLTAAGYNYYGLETLYSGIDGREFKAEIFIGIVYYQRLRHMIADKFQVRSTGPVDSVTHQPIKGRQRGGGVRFGEMERDALIAHGTSALLRDRLCLSSDKDSAEVCGVCGSMVAVWAREAGAGCRECGSSQAPTVTIPYVFRYLLMELASMNIKTTLTLTDPATHISTTPLSPKPPSTPA